MADVLLINPLPRSWYTEEMRKVVSSPPLGLLYLGSYLESHGYAVRCCDLVVRSISLGDFLEILEQENPRVVGISSTTEAITSALQVCSVIKNWNPNCVTVLGGPHPTFQHSQLAGDKNVDCVVRHEGEEAFLEVVNLVIRQEGRPEGIRGATWSENGRIVVNEPRPFRQDLDGLPHPARHLLDLSLYTEPGSIVSSRGCPANCVFCSAGSMAGGKYRARTADAIVEELKHLSEKYKINRFFIVDDTFTAIRKRAERVCELVSENFSNIIFTCESRVDVVNHEFLRLLKDAGCVSIQYGVESGSDEVLRRIGKRITTAQIRNAFRWTYEAGIRIKGSFIIGLPDDTRETVLQTWALARELQRNYDAEMYPSINTPFPGTVEFERAEEYGINIFSDNWDDFLLSNPVIGTEGLGRDEIRHLYFEIASEMMDANLALRAKYKSQEQEGSFDPKS